MRLRRGLFIGICCNLVIAIGFIIVIFYRGKDPVCDQKISSASDLENLSVEHSNIFTTVESFHKLQRLRNCSFHPELLKMPMNVLLERFNDIYKSSCILQPPLLVSTLDFYIGSYSTNLRRSQLHLTFIDCYYERECYGSYKSVLDQQAFPIDLIKTHFRNDSDLVKSSFSNNTRRFSCVFQWDSGQHVSAMRIANTKMGGSAYCRLPQSVVPTASTSKFLVKVLIVSRHSDNVHILCKIKLNLFDLNVPVSVRNLESKPFNLILACAPLTWSQIEKNILLEWIIYHRLVGVDHFLIYIKETNILNVHRIVKYLNPLIHSHTVTLINWQFGAFFEPENAFQIPQMIDAIQRTADFSVWTLISDTDEFFFPEHHNTLTEILGTYQMIAEENLNISYRQELTIANVHMMRGEKKLHSRFTTGQYFSRHRATKQPLRSKIIAYSGSDRFLAAEEVHFFLKDSTFVPEQLIRLNHYFNAYNESRKPVERIYYVREDLSLWQRFGDKIEKNFYDYNKQRDFHSQHLSGCLKNK